MPQTQPRAMTTSEFLDWEARQERKWEFDGFAPVAMNGGTAAHSTIQGNIIMALKQRLRTSRCKPFGPDVRVPIPVGSYRYPDAFVTCIPLPPKSLDAPEPAVIFEVISDSTERIDRHDKLIEYRTIPSLQRYVIAEQDEAALTVIARTAHGWSIETLRDGDTLALPEIGIEIPVAELYLDVPFAPAPE